MGSYSNNKQASEVETKPGKKKMENKINTGKRHGSEEQFYVFYARLEFHKFRARVNANDRTSSCLQATLKQSSYSITLCSPRA